jgi:asparagine synthase (glutamine-hydrolysing)
MVGDVPFGLLLSGGVDSSALLVLMKQLGLSAPKAFTISFPERSFNENSYAKRMADLVGATYYEEELNSKKAYELIHPITDHMDEPLADPSLVPTWLLSSLAREHVTFVLGGDGGDELFGGYPSFEFQKLLSFIEPFESIAGTLIRRMSRWRRPSPDYRGIQFVVDKLVSGAGLPLPLKHLAWLGAFPLSEISSLMSTSLGNAVTDDIREDVLRSWSQTEGSPVFNRLQSLYFRYYLAEGILVKVDRASMAHSLEVRNPYLDFELVDFVNSIPNSLKMRGLITKYALKKCFQHHIPKDILFRRKQGFAVPIAKWLREDFRELLQDLLSPPRIRAQGLFDPDRVQGYVKEHLSGDVDHRKRLWSLLMFQLWEQKWNRPA